MKSTGRNLLKNKLQELCRNKLRKKRHGFSLLELLVAIVLITLLLTLISPAMNGFRGSAARKGAVSLVMTTLEQARILAIETGREVVVVFWKKNGTAGTPADEQDAMIVLRRNETETGWEQMNRWIKIPHGILFPSDDTASSILCNVPTEDIHSILPHSPTSEHLGAVHFSPSGAVQRPGTSAGLRIALTEGRRGADGALLAEKQNSGTYEIISLARYTGRATLDISSL